MVTNTQYANRHYGAASTNASCRKDAIPEDIQKTEHDTFGRSDRRIGLIVWLIVYPFVPSP